MVKVASGKLHRNTNCRKCEHFGHYITHCPFSGTEDEEATEGVSNMQVDDDDHLLDSDSDEGSCFLHTTCLMSTKARENLTMHEIVLDTVLSASVLATPDLFIGIKRVETSLELLTRGVTSSPS